jgi:hypothetical protein
MIWSIFRFESIATDPDSWCEAQQETYGDKQQGQAESDFQFSLR